MSNFLKKLLVFAQRFSGKWWYGPLIALMAGLDAYVFVVSVEALLLPAVLLHPEKWIIISLWGTLGSAIGATSFAALISIYGESIINHWIPGALNSKAWIHSSNYLVEHGMAGLTFISAGPLPQHIAVAVAGLAHMRLNEVFFAILIGRGIKYLFLSWLAFHSPKVLKKFGLLPTEKTTGSKPEEPGFEQ